MLTHIINCLNNSFLLKHGYYINLHCYGFCFPHPHKIIEYYTLERIHWPTLLKAFGYNLPRCAVMKGALYRLETKLENITS